MSHCHPTPGHAARKDLGLLFQPELYQLPQPDSRIESSRRKILSTMKRLDMRRTRICAGWILSAALLFLVPEAASAQIDVGNFTIRGEAEIGGMPRRFTGRDAKFEEYRDLPESVIVPQLQLMIGGKKEDFYLDLGSSKTGLDDQNYRLRFGRYGLLDIELEWDQIPHIFSIDTARTPYGRDG